MFLQTSPCGVCSKRQSRNELDCLQKEGIITPVEFSDWAAPIAPVVKQVHLCGDYSVTVNAVSKLDSYPLPKVDEHRQEEKTSQNLTFHMLSAAAPIRRIVKVHNN